MDSEKNDKGEFHFSKTFSVEEGEYQYKFRLGPGGWWELNSEEAVVDDGDGNKNNLLIVKPAAPTAPATQPADSVPQSAADQSTPKSTEQPATTQPAAAPQPLPSDHADSSVAPSTVPLLPHEAVATQRKSEEQPAAAQKPQTMKHETLAPEPQRADSMQEEMDSEDEDDDEGEQESTSSPLLRHESFAPDATEETQAPLLRHETSALGEHADEPDHYSDRLDTLSPVKTRFSGRGAFSPQRLSRHSSTQSVLAPEADANDLSLERFPTDHNGIFEAIRKTSIALPEDQTTEAVNIGSPVGSAISDNSLSSVASLPIVREDREEEMAELEKIDEQAAEMEWAELLEIERKEAAQEAEVEEPDANAPVITVIDVEQRPTAPMTPPMTPKEAEQAEQIIEKQFYVKSTTNEGGRDDNADGQQTDEDGQELRENVILDVMQDKSFAGTLLNLLVHPALWLSVAGVAAAVMAGYWKLRYA